MRFLVKHYDRRVVNVNVNIIAAGLLALIPTTIIVHLTRHMDIHNEYAIMGIMLVADLISDVAIYYALHWIANHMPRKAPRKVNPAYADMSFIRDASLVQFERAILSPVLYTFAISLMFLLMQRYSIDFREEATVISFVVAIAITRTLHTLWMLRVERKAQARVDALASGAGERVPGFEPTPVSVPPPPTADRVESVSSERAG